MDMEEAVAAMAESPDPQQTKRLQHAQKLVDAQANSCLGMVGERVRQMTAANITGAHVDEVRALHTKHGRVVAHRRPPACR